jgi:hypothetical protein
MIKYDRESFYFEMVIELIIYLKMSIFILLGYVIDKDHTTRNRQNFAQLFWGKSGPHKNVNTYEDVFLTNYVSERCL